MSTTLTEPYPSNLTEIDEEAFTTRLRILDLPPLIEERRRAAWAKAQNLPEPRRKDEAWRFASRPTYYTENPLVEDANLHEAFEFDPGIPYAGEIVYEDHQLVRFHVEPDLVEKGVVFQPYVEFLRDHPEKIDLIDRVPAPNLGSEKYDQLNAAMADGGYILYVPRGIEISEPFFVVNRFTRPGGFTFARTHVVIEANASAEVIESISSTGEHRGGVASFASRVAVEDNGCFHRKTIQDLSPSSRCLLLDSETVGRSARYKSLAVHLGCRRSRYENVANILGPGAEAHLYSLTVATGDREFDQRTLQIHEAPNSYSDLLFKNVLLDTSRTIFSGLIQVAEGAQQTDAYQTNRNLLLDPTAVATSLPGLEIEANDVKCSHGATTGKMDEEELFYMMQRGIPKRVAQELAVFGFLEEIVNLFDREGVKEHLRSLLRMRFHN